MLKKLLKVRPARKEDYQAILEILAELDLAYHGQNLQNFLVAEIKKKIIGVVELEERTDFLFFSAFGVKKDYQKQGLSSIFIDEVLSKSPKDIYLYTIIPDYFIKHGFEITRQSQNLPNKNALECDTCSPKLCKTLVYRKKI